MSYDQGILQVGNVRSPTYTNYDLSDRLLITAILKSYFTDIEHYINYAVCYAPQSQDYYFHMTNSIIRQMLELEFFRNNINNMNIRLEEIINMAYTKNAKKADKTKEKNEGMKVEFKGSNKNVFSASVWKPKKWNKEGYTGFFCVLTINGLAIVSRLMIPSNAAGEWESIKEIAGDSFFAFPSYYNEDKKEYNNQVFIPKDNDGLKEDLDEMVEYTIAELRLLDV